MGDLSISILATQMRDHDRTPVSWLWSSTALGVLDIWGEKEQVKDLSLPVSVSDTPFLCVCLSSQSIYQLMNNGDHFYLMGLRNN